MRKQIPNSVTAALKTLRNTLMISAVVFAGPAMAQEDQQSAAQSLDQLLNEVRQTMQQESVVNREREQEFAQQRNQQRQLLQQARNELQQLEARSDQLKNEFDENELQLAELETTLQERMGNLGELFGVVRQVAGDVAGTLESSLATAQFPGRAEFLRDLAQRKALPNIRELRRLWFEIQRQITENGKIVTFTASVLDENGEPQEGVEVTRVGVFTAADSEGKFLEWNPPAEGNPGKLSVLPRQPASRWVSTSRNFVNTPQGEMAPVALDPSRGAILSLVVQSPSPMERIRQGGLVGYLILGLGAIGLLLVVYRFLVLYTVGARIHGQLKDDEPRENNPLGRVMQVYHDNPDEDTETLELKLDEAILKETEPLERGLTTIKIIYVVAPLMGLLGTVVGMIETFQQITLFGTGDPKLMAGGISKALVTTVLGLSVAIPITLLHGLLATKSRRLIHLLEEQSAGIVARHAEKRHAGSS